MYRKNADNLIYLIFIMIFGLVIIGFVTNVHGKTTMVQGAEYTIDETEIGFAWGPSEGAIGYEFKLIMTDRNPVTEYAFAKTAQTQITVKRPRAGHFTAMVRAYKDTWVCQKEIIFKDCAGRSFTCYPEEFIDPCEPGTDMPDGVILKRVYSEWTHSTDKERATVEGQSLGWWIYWKLPAPGFEFEFIPD